MFQLKKCNEKTLSTDEVERVIKAMSHQSALEHWSVLASLLQQREEEKLHLDDSVKPECTEAPNGMSV
ncbi:hypothetical protein TYRP_004848 [Tyrophagus putrescentiae]|nr:hypothetical protein TYRP_004848 [Tyrophagus putrescentiae]